MLANTKKHNVDILTLYYTRDDNRNASPTFNEVIIRHSLQGLPVSRNADIK